MSASLEAEVLRLQLRVARLEGQADRPISLSIRQVVRAVSLHFNIPDRVLLGDARARHIVLARHVAMHLCHAVHGHSLSRIGRAFGRDHTSVLHATRRIAALLPTDPTLAAQVDALAEALSDPTVAQTPIREA